MNPDDDRAQVLAHSDALWSQLCAALDAHLAGALGPSTDWTGHDVYAHFDRWQRQSIEACRRLVAGEPQAAVEAEEDELNMCWRAEDQSLATDAVRERAHESRAHLREVMTALTPDQWSKWRRVFEDITGPHYEAHLAWIGERAR